MTDGGSTPLHQAAVWGHAGIVSALLLRGANKDAIDRNGATSLVWAAEKGRLAAVETLLAAGADLKTRDYAKESALDNAAFGGHGPVIKAILRHGAGVNGRDVDGFSVLHKVFGSNQVSVIDDLVQAGANIEPKTKNGLTPLMVAATLGSDKSLLTLLNRGAAAVVRDGRRETALHHACWGKGAGLEIAVYLLVRWVADETAVDIFDKHPRVYSAMVLCGVRKSRSSAPASCWRGRRPTGLGIGGAGYSCFDHAL